MKSFKTKARTLRVYALPLVYFCIVTFIGVSAARQGLSSYYADAAVLSESEKLAAAAISYQPDNPYAYRSLGMVLLQNKDYRGAAEAFESAVKLRGNDFFLWIRLGLCREKSGQFEAAEAAYERAIALAPNYVQPKNNLGKMLLDNRRFDEAFRFLSEAAANDNELYPEVLDFAFAAFPNDPDAIESAVRPASAEAKKIVARYFIRHDLMTVNIRSFLLSGELDAKDKDDFIRSLIDKKNFRLAREIWLTTVKPDSPDELIFDGGFERTTESDEYGFGWRIDQKASALAVSINEKEFHSGTRSVRLKFAGDVELNRKLLSQLTYLVPGRKYRLTYFLRSAEMISAGLPRVVVHDAVSGESLARSAAIQTTGDKWAESVIDFVANDTPAVVISLERPPCNASPCPLFGELLLDDFSLTEVQK